MNTNLVTIINGQPVTSSEVIAEGAGNQHKNVLELIRQNINDLEEFGLVAFETRARLQGQHGGADVEYALLNEQQTTLILTYMRNTEIIRKFKKALVKAFFDMAGRLQHQPLPDKAVTEAFKLMPAAVRAAKALGLDKNAAAISANQLVSRLTNVNLLSEFGHTHLVAENQDHLYFTPSELGEELGESGRMINTLLAKAGLQIKHGQIWAPTEAAKGLYRFFDTGKQHGSGTPIQQMKWSDAVLKVIDQEGSAA